ncbi:MAG: hypothetical protein ACO3UU_05755 [Minisyncoccia bacterium]
MKNWVTESTRIFVDNLLKEDIGLGHMVDDGQTKTVMVQPVESRGPNVLDSIRQACNEIDIENISRQDLEMLNKIHTAIKKIK